MSIRVDSLLTYPLKSAAGLRLAWDVVGPQGVLYDRQWMVVDEHGMFVAQRGDRGLGVAVRSMSLIQPHLTQNDIIFTAPDMPYLELPLYFESTLAPVQVWDTKFYAIEQGDTASKWITDYLSSKRKGTYRLVRFSREVVRQTSRGNGVVGFADSYPIHLISQASLYDLSRRVGAEIPLERFRPNIVISGCDPYQEDTFTYVRIGELELEVVKQCVRCPITTFTPSDTKSRSKEPLRTLAGYRKTEKGVVFGVNLVVRKPGIVRVGDPVFVE